MNKTIKIIDTDDKNSHLFKNIKNVVELSNNNLNNTAIVVGNDRYNDVYEKDNVFMEGKLNHHYLLLYYLSVIMQPISILEIGVFKGYSLTAILKGIDNVNKSSVGYYGIDNLSYPHGGINGFLKAKSAIDILLGSDQYSFFISDSKRVLNLFISSNFDFDFIFVDGDHTYDGAHHDMQNVQEVLTEGGVILFDDCEMKELTTFISDVKQGKTQFRISEFNFVQVSTNHTGMAFFAKKGK